MATVPFVSKELGNWILGVPRTICKKIHEQSSTTAQEREELIHYYLSYSPYASWSHLAGWLFYKQHHNALSAAKKFIKAEPGELL